MAKIPAVILPSAPSTHNKGVSPKTREGVHEKQWGLTKNKGVSPKTRGYDKNKGVSTQKKGLSPKARRVQK